MAASNEQLSIAEHLKRISTGIKLQASSRCFHEERRKKPPKLPAVVRVEGPTSHVCGRAAAAAAAVPAVVPAAVPTARFRSVYPHECGSHAAVNEPAERRLLR